MKGLAMTRRTFVGGSLGLALGAEATALPARAAVHAADDEAFWGAVASQYQLAPGPVNLENGYCGMMARPVLEDYLRQVSYVNERTSLMLRREYDAGGKEAVLAQVAALAGVSPGELVFTRGATESLQCLISNYRLLKAGDTVMYADLDYDSAQTVMDSLAARRGVNVVRIAIPEPATTAAILDTYARALDAHPRTRLLLVTHVSHRTGLVMPVPDIVQLARSRNADVIVDAAHSWGQLDFSVPDLQADFAAFNLHKWMGAPLGVGLMYIRKGRIGDIAPQFDNHDFPEDDIRARVETGTTNTANVLAVPAALAFQRQVGIANKAARLRYLREHWVRQVRGLKGVQVLTPDDPARYGAITSFRIAGKTSAQDNAAIARRLLDEYGLFTVQRGGVAAGNCVRVTPALFTTLSDLDRLAAAIKAIAV